MGRLHLELAKLLRRLLCLLEPQLQLAHLGHAGLVSLLCAPQLVEAPIVFAVQCPFCGRVRGLAFSAPPQLRAEAHLSCTAVPGLIDCRGEAGVRLLQEEAHVSASREVINRSLQRLGRLGSA